MKYIAQSRLRTTAGAPNVATDGFCDIPMFCVSNMFPPMKRRRLDRSHWDTRTTCHRGATRHPTVATELLVSLVSCVFMRPVQAQNGLSREDRATSIIMLQCCVPARAPHARLPGRC